MSCVWSLVPGIVVSSPVIAAVAATLLRPVVVGMPAVVLLRDIACALYGCVCGLFSLCPLFLVLAFLVFVKAGEAFLFYQVDWPCRLAVVRDVQSVGLFAVLVLLDDGERSFCRYCHKVGGKPFVGAVSDLVGQGVGFEIIIRTVFCFELYFSAWQLLYGFDVGVSFVVQAAFQFGALSSQFLRIE